MKIKIIVASLSLLNLISCSAFADTDQKHHTKKMYHRHVSDYKEMGALPVQTGVVPAPVIEATPNDPRQITLQAMTQNLGRADIASPDWFQRIGVAGGMNVDGHWGTLDNGYDGENGRRIAVNDAYLNVTGYINDWTKAFLSLSFQNAGSGTTISTLVQPGRYSNAYTYDRLNAEEAYITLGNFDCTPFFVQVGKQFQDFGRYQIHALTRTLAQDLSESLQTSAKIAFVTEMGFNGSAYIFDNTINETGTGHTTPVYGFALGYEHPSEQLGYDVGVGYMSNMTGVNDVAYAINIFNLDTGFTKRVSALNAYGDVNSGPFTLGARYTTALSTFNPADLTVGLVDSAGAKPWAFDITAGYNFDIWARSQNIYVGYQHSGDAINIFLPRTRWLAGYGIDVVKNTSLTLEWDHDRAYNTNLGGTDKSSNLVGLRLAVKFG